MHNCNQRRPCTNMSQKRHENDIGIYKRCWTSGTNDQRYDTNIRHIMTVLSVIMSLASSMQLPSRLLGEWSCKNKADMAEARGIKEHANLTSLMVDNL